MRRRLLLSGLVGLVGLIAVVVIVLAAALPGIVRWAAVSGLARSTGRTVTLDGLELSLTRGRLALRGLRVIDRDGGPLLTLDRAEIRFAPRELLRLHGHITDATFQAVTVRIVRTGPNEYNVSDLLRPRAEPKKPGKAPAFTLDRLDLSGASIVVEDRTLTPPRTWRVDPLEIHAHELSTVAGAPPGEASLTAVAVNAPIVVSLTEIRLAPLALKGVLTVHNVDASLAAVYLPPASPISPARGTLTVSASVEHDQATGTKVALDAAFADVDVRRPGQEVPYLTAPAVTVRVEDLHLRERVVELGRLKVDVGSIVLEDTRFGNARRWQVDGIGLEARNLSSARDAPPGVATVRAATAGARLEVWGTNVRLAPVELSATVIVRNVDLSLAQLYLPPSLPIRPQRGIINATVRVEHDARRGTRLGLDAGLAGIELERPQHFVTAPAVRVTVDDVALDGGAVAVGRVRVTGDRLTLEERTAKPVRTWPVQDFVLEAKDLSSRRDAVQGVANLRATVAGASASVFVTGARLQPLEFHATAILRGVDANVVRFYLPPEMPFELRRGVVNATVDVGQAADSSTVTADATLTGLEAQGRQAFATSVVTAPSLRLAIAGGQRQGTSLSIGRIELTGTGSLADARDKLARLDFSSLRVATEGLTWPVAAPAKVEVSLHFQDRGELDGSGTARLTAPLPAIAWAADLALKFRGVDLAPLGVYVPAAAGLGGRVRADVTASLAYAGTLTAQVRGEVGGARFALVEGDRTLLSLRGINASGLDVAWPERVGIKQLRLREPYALVTRSPDGTFPLATKARPARPDQATPAPVPAPSTTRPLPSLAIEEVLVEDGKATFVDEGASPAVRVELPRVKLTARNVTWPATAPVDLALEGTLPAGGSLKVTGSATAEPLGVDVSLVGRDFDLNQLQPYLGFRARVGGRVTTNLTVAGQLTPAPRVKVKGEVTLRALDVADGGRSVITAELLTLGGIEADWPTRVAIDRVRVGKAWAQIERDPQGRFLLRDLLERPGAKGPSPAAAAATAPSQPLQVSFREGVFEDQSATILDAAVSPPVRLDVKGARLAVYDFNYPQTGPARVEVSSPMPGGGTVEATGTVLLTPMRLETKAKLDAVAVEALQSYAPIEGRVSGKVSGDLAVKVGLDPTSVQVTGAARLQAFRLNDGDRPVVTVGRLETTGVDVDWPRRITLASVKLRRPQLLVERDDKGEFRLRRLVTPRWAAGTPAPTAPATGTTPAVPPPPTASSRQAPSIEIGTLSLEKALARFVDYTTDPDYAEELEDVDITFTPLTTARGRSTRFSLNGSLGGGSIAIKGTGSYGDRPALDMTLEIRNYIMPRADPYLAHYTGWVARNGTLDVKGVYKLDGTQLETRHDVLARGLEVASLDERDEVARRVGLPFGMLVSLLKDARGEIKLTLPVSGDISKREFDYKDAVWSSVRSLATRLIALPFSKIGSLFFGEDSKVKAVSLAPVVFEPGTEKLGPDMESHLGKVAEFMKGAPAVKVTLEPVLIEADIQALKRAQVLARLNQPGEGDAAARARREFVERWPDRAVPETLDALVDALLPAETLTPDAMRTLGTRRLDAVRDTLTRAGIDAARLPGSARRAPLVEAAGRPRIEFDLRS
jgi:uncharacterized protein involved in outer membrane biogenesis